MLFVSTYVAASFTAIRLNNGYAKATAPVPTSHAAWEIARFNASQITDADRADADAALAHLSTLQFSEFNEKMQRAANPRSGTVARPDGMLAYVAENYRRHLSKQAAAASNATLPSAGAYVGNVGDKISGLQVTVQSVREINTRFGACNVVTYADVDGNVYVWLSNADGTQVKTGDTLVISGTIKAHKEFDRVKQTSLTRVRHTRRAA